jgi:hypothetical protein
VFEPSLSGVTMSDNLANEVIEPSKEMGVERDDVRHVSDGNSTSGPIAADSAAKSSTAYDVDMHVSAGTELEEEMERSKEAIIAADSAAKSSTAYDVDMHASAGTELEEEMERSKEAIIKHEHKVKHQEGDQVGQDVCDYVDEPEGGPNGDAKDVAAMSVTAIAGSEIKSQCAISVQFTDDKSFCPSRYPPSHFDTMSCVGLQPQRGWPSRIGPSRGM